MSRSDLLEECWKRKTERRKSQFLNVGKNPFLPEAQIPNNLKKTLYRNFSPTTVHTSTNCPGLTSSLKATRNQEAPIVLGGGPQKYLRLKGPTARLLSRAPSNTPYYFSFLEILNLTFVYTTEGKGTRHFPWNPLRLNRTLSDTALHQVNVFFLFIC